MPCIVNLLHQKISLLSVIFTFLHVYIELKTLDDKGFCLFYKLNQSELPIDKNIDNIVLSFYYHGTCIGFYFIRFYFSF